MHASRRRLRSKGRVVAMRFPHQSDEYKVSAAPVSFLVIGIAVGMVLMMILFRHFEMLKNLS